MISIDKGFEKVININMFGNNDHHDIRNTGKEMLKLMKVKGLLFDPYNSTYIIIMRDEDNNEILPIWIGKPEANAIGFALEGIFTPRPMTHDLMKNVLDSLDAKLISIVITDLNENTYYAKIHLLHNDSEMVIDSRPSDAVALALRVNAPIFATDDVLKKYNAEELDRWLENLRPEDFGKYDA